MKMNRISIRSFFLLLMSLFLFANCRPADRVEESSATAVEKEEQARLQQLFAEYHRAFPAATLKDMYKYGFQDFLGPAHIIRDSLSCARYVESEMAYLDSIGWRYSEPYEPLQFVGRHVRVNILTVKEGKITTEQLVSALMRSGVQPDSAALVAWKNLWPALEQDIAPLADSLPEYAEDIALIDSLLTS